VGRPPHQGERRLDGQRWRTEPKASFSRAAKAGRGPPRQKCGTSSHLLRATRTENKAKLTLMERGPDNATIHRVFRREVMRPAAAGACWRVVKGASAGRRPDTKFFPGTCSCRWCSTDRIPFTWLRIPRNDITGLLGLGPKPTPCAPTRETHGCPPLFDHMSEAGKPKPKARVTFEDGEDLGPGDRRAVRG